MITGPQILNSQFQKIPVRYKNLSSPYNLIKPLPSIQYTLDATYQQQNLVQSCKNYEILVLIKTAITHFKLRYAIRNTWQQKIRDNLLYDTVFQYYFVAAKSHNPILQNRLNNEVLQYRDILVATQLDSYFNVTRKMVMGMKFVLDSCSQARYIVHVDDDTYFSADRFYKNMFKYLQADRPSDYVDCGNFINKAAPVFRADNQAGQEHPEWVVDVQGYSSKKYPSYCSGSCFGMPIDAYRKIYNYTQHFNLQGISKLDDVILTGIARTVEKLKLFAATDNFCWHLDNKKGEIENRMIGLHNKFQANKNYFLLENRRRKKRENDLAWLMHLAAEVFDSDVE